MTKLKYLTMFFTAALLISCSSNDSGCGSVLEPTGNEFTYNCNSYPTQHARFVIFYPHEGVSTVSLEFLNDPYGNFHLQVGNENINRVRLHLIISEESYHNGVVPDGNYTLGEPFNEAPFDVTNFTQLVYDNYLEDVYGATLFGGNRLIENDYDVANVTISKTGAIYTINYYFKKGNKEVKGRYVGEIEITFD